MAYKFDNYDNSLVIDGWENGIGDAPEVGLADMRNVNIASVPGEAFVNFSTFKVSSPTITTTVTVTGLAASAISFAAVTGLENGMAIQFTAVGGLTGVATATTYWAQSAAGNPTTSIKLYSDFLQTAAVAIGGAASGSPTFTIFNVGGVSSATAPVYFTYTNSTFNDYFMLDGKGQLWSNHKLTTSGYWCYTGLTGTADTNAGSGLAFYQSTKTGNGFVFVFNGQSIDYFSLQTYTWTWGWKPSTGGTHQTAYLNAINNHEAMLMPTNQLCYCDGQYIGRFYEKNPATDFDPLTTSTYVFDTTQLLPSGDKAISLSYLGTNVMVGGTGNVIYPWNGTSSTFNYPILLPEYNVKHMVTVNTSTYIFLGNRGRIYVTNGTGVQLYKKVPDHISGTVEPYYTWGGVMAHKNQLYFGLAALSNASANINQYGGLWAINLDTAALRLANQLSYATYGGNATALIPNFSTNPAGMGMFIGWSDGTNSSFGIDSTVSPSTGLAAPYTGSQATIDSDLIPIGTFNKPRDFTMIEYKLAKPLVSGESIVIKTRLIFNTTDTGYATTLTDSTAGNFSNSANINFKTAQWVQFQIVLNSTTSTPSYVRLKQIRILGLTGPTLATSEQLAL